ncbi:hypothetical protein BJX99DRAFT_216826 [Aspergillus californicus]
MLRFKPTRIALTEDDLCFHLDSIFSRHDQFAEWHRQPTESGTSYNGDNDDEDGLFLDSDTFSLPETLLDSECEDSESQTLTGNNPQGSISHAQAIVGTNRARSPSSSSFPSLLSNTDRGTLSITHSLVWLNFQPTDDVLVTRLARLFSPIIALSLRFSRHEGINKSENSRRTSLPLNSSNLDLWRDLEAKIPLVYKPFILLPGHRPQNQLIHWKPAPPLPKMKRCRSKSASPDGDQHGYIFSEVDVPETKGQGCVAESSSNSANAAPQYSTIQGSESCTLKRHSSSPAGSVSSRTTESTSTEAEEGNCDEYIRGVRQSVSQQTVSRGTQTDPGSEIPSRAISRAADKLIENRFLRQENVNPDAPFQLIQDPFISTMFGEPSAEAYDATVQLHRRVEGHDTSRPRRGRAPRTQEGIFDQLVHPTLVDAAMFQEYVHHLLAELDGAP